MIININGKMIPVDDALKIYKSQKKCKERFGLDFDEYNELITQLLAVIRSKNPQPQQQLQQGPSNNGPMPFSTGSYSSLGDSFNSGILPSSYQPINTRHLSEQYQQQHGTDLGLIQSNTVPTETGGPDLLRPQSSQYSQLQQEFSSQQQMSQMPTQQQYPRPQHAQQLQYMQQQQGQQLAQQHQGQQLAQQSQYPQATAQQYMQMHPQQGHYPQQPQQGHYPQQPQSQQQGQYPQQLQSQQQGHYPRQPQSRPQPQQGHYPQPQPQQQGYPQQPQQQQQFYQGQQSWQHPSQHGAESLETDTRQGANVQLYNRRFFAQPDTSVMPVGSGPMRQDFPALVPESGFNTNKICSRTFDIGRSALNDTRLDSRSSYN